MLKVRATFDYGSRPLLQLASYPFKERSSNLHVQALSQRNFVCSVPELRVLLQNLVDLVPEATVISSQRFVFGRSGSRARKLIGGRRRAGRRLQFGTRVL